jgi:predicted nucleic acid-binding protein
MRNASPNFFLDTNILAYVYDAKDVAKRERAGRVVEILGASGDAAISTQVLGELYSSLTRGRGLNIPHEVAEASIQRYLQSWTVFQVAPLHILEAMRGVREHKLSYYDALIWATARLNGVPYILSEDGQDGRNIDGVRTLNPLSLDFDLTSLS